MISSYVNYGKHIAQCASSHHPEVDVYVIPFRYPIAPDKAVEWSDVIIKNNTQISINPKVKITKTQSLSPFTGVFLAPRGYFVIPPLTEQGFRFQKNPDFLEICVEFDLPVCKDFVRYVVLNTPNFSAYREHIVNNLDIAYWNPAEPEAPSLLDTKFLSDTVLLEIKKNPNIVHELHPNIFERVVAEIFRKNGFEVALTGKTADGGIDIIAITPSRLSPTRHLIQCKRYKDKIGITLVRELYGVKSDTSASKIVLATTSSFTSPAIEFAKRHSWEISLIDYNKLIELLSADRL